MTAADAAQRLTATNFAHAVLATAEFRGEITIRVQLPMRAQAGLRALLPRCTRVSTT